MTRLLDWACLCSWFSLVWYDGLGTMMVLMLLLSRTRRSVVHLTWGFINYSCIFDMTRSYATLLIHMWHDSFICDVTDSNVTCLINMWHGSFKCAIVYSYVSWLIRMQHDSIVRDRSRSYVPWLNRERIRLKRADGWRWKEWKMTAHAKRHLWSVALSYSEPISELSCCAEVARINLSLCHQKTTPYVVYF